MAGYGYTKTYSLMTGAAGNNSVITSVNALVADWNIISLSWQTAGTSASTLTVQGTLSEGLRATIAEAEWSNLTLLTSAGIYTVDPGARWIRVLRGSPESQSTIFIGGRSY